ncbi:MAG: T9SS type A sorting domain-containing protein, partial [Bacteroidota bacterium]
FVTAPVLADLDGDGRKEILIVSSKGRLYGFNGQGVLLDGFPVDLGLPAPAVMYGPLVGDVNGDGHSEILNIDVKGDLWSYSPASEKRAEMLFRAGDITAKSPSFLHRRLNGSTTLGFVSVDGRGQIAAFDLSVPYSSLWPMFRYDPAGTAFASAVTPSPKPITSEFLPRSRVYNWPNPVYTSSTQIRYFTSEDAEISVKVFDLAGEKITELNARSTGGVDGEVRWDVSGVQSGVYLARVEATANGRSEVAIIKIAVVK